MIVSHQHKYLFIALPRTGSTAVSKELMANYGGERILRKHSFFHEFQNMMNSKGNEYFVFSCIRNPLDDVVSTYFKFKTDHAKEFSEAKNVKRSSLKRFEFIRNNNDFPAFLRKYYKVPYDNWSSLEHKKFDFVIKYENIQNDFKKALELIGIEQKRPIPVINKTSAKGNFLSYYPPEIQAYAKYVFGPFMKRWGYEFPAEWSDEPVPISAEMLYLILSLPRKGYWLYIQHSTSTFANIVKRIIGR